MKIRRWQSAWLLALCWLMGTALAASGPVKVQDVRLWNAPDHTRLVFDLDRRVEHRIFSLDKPPRLVIDFAKTRLATRLSGKRLKSRHITGLRYARRKDGTLRVVLDLIGQVRPRSFLLQPGGGHGHRLVVDLYDRKAAATVVKETKPPKDPAKGRDIVVAVDAGHGGEDPGARGRRHKTQEKAITLAIARRLKTLIDAQPGMRAILTRKGDYFVPLRKRIRIARRHKADLFVSIHADAFRDERARGASVFVLSRKGASSEAARWLAERENASDLIGGVSLEDKDDVLASVLLDLAQSSTLAASIRAAKLVHRQIGRISRLHGRRVQHAGFVVLKSPDIPSMLVETGFISNPREEKLLRSHRYQQRIAEAIFKGIREYFDREPPPGSRLALEKERKAKKQAPIRYVIRPGDTLSTIAARHRVSVADLRNENGLKGDRIRAGQVLRIPRT